MKRPFVWFAFGLIVGIVSAAYLNIACFAAVLIAVTAVSAYMGIKRKVTEHLYVPVLCALGFLICSAAMAEASSLGDGFDNKEATVFGTVRTYYITDSGNIAITLDAEMIVYDEGTVNEKLRLFVTAENADVHAGDLIRIKGRMYGFDEATNPYQTNYEKYMLSSGIDCRMWAESVENMGSGNDSPIYAIERARERVNGFFDRVLPEDTASVIKALTTGYKYDINEKTRDAYRNLGISHLLAVSGIHVSVIAGAVFLLFSKIFGGSRRKAMPFAAAVLVLYLFFTGASPSAMRAVIMTITIYVGYILCKGSDRLNITAFSAFVMLLMEPLYLWNISFQLSYAGITAVSIAGDMLAEGKNRNIPLKAIMFSFIVWIMTTPLTMYFFGGVSLISPLTNMIFVPYISFATGISILSALMSFFGDIVFPAKIAGEMIAAYNYLDKTIGTDIFYLETSKPSLAAVVGIYVFMAAVIYFRNRGKLLMTITAAFTAAAGVYAFSALNAPAEIVFFDAGQGDSSAIYVPGDIFIVIDGGPKSGAEGSVIPYIEAKKGKADVLFISHTDEDHAGGALEIMKRGMTDTVVMSEYADREKTEEIMRTARENGIGVIFVSAGDSFIYDGCEIECLYPKDGKAKNENETSLVLNVSVAGVNVLFTGDINSGNEEELLKSDINCDIIKIAHHGSETSSSEAFLRRTDAKTAVIEAAKDNRYGFPHEKVTERLDRLGMDTYITGRDGAIVFYADNGIKNVKTFGRQENEK